MEEGTSLPGDRWQGLEIFGVVSLRMAVITGNLLLQSQQQERDSGVTDTDPVQRNHGGDISSHLLCLVG